MNPRRQDRTLPQLDRRPTLQTTDVMLISGGGDAQKVTLAQLAAYFGGGGGGGGGAPETCTVSLSTDYTWPTRPIIQPWQIATGTIPSAWDAAAPTDIVMPEGFTRAQITANIEFNNVATGAGTFAQIYINGSTQTGVPRASKSRSNLGYSNNNLQLPGAIIAISPGDTISLYLNASTTQINKTLATHGTWMQAAFYP